MATAPDNVNNQRKQVPRPFRRAVLRGMGILFPPLFTILIFVWIINTTDSYVMRPVTHGAREILVWATADIRYDLPALLATATSGGRVYHRVGNRTFIPLEVYERVEGNPGEPPPLTATEFYRRYVDLTYLRPYVTIPTFIALFVLLLYLLGKFIAAGVGRFFWDLFEGGIRRLPLVRGVYSSVKQVSDFLFSEREFRFTRVVAVEYPRKGLWSLGFVTGESFLEIRGTADEPVVTVLVPFSPPLTGATISVRKSETIDLNLTVDQAFQFIMSCGVIVPPHQLLKNDEVRMTNDEGMTKIPNPKS